MPGEAIAMQAPIVKLKSLGGDRIYSSLRSVYRFDGLKQT